MANTYRFGPLVDGIVASANPRVTTANPGGPSQFVGLGKLLAADRSMTGYQPQFSIPGKWNMIQPGNIDLKARPMIRNPDGSVSTVRSITVTLDGGKAVLLPTVASGRIVSPQEAIHNYMLSGQHLGIFPNEAAADRYAEALHNQQASFYGV